MTYPSIMTIICFHCSVLRTFLPPSHSSVFSLPRCSGSFRCTRSIPSRRGGTLVEASHWCHTRYTRCQSLSSHDKTPLYPWSFHHLLILSSSVAAAAAGCRKVGGGRSRGVQPFPWHHRLFDCIDCSKAHERGGRQTCYFAVSKISKIKMIAKQHHP